MPESEFAGLSVWGLTGGIGAGKSAAALAFAAEGIAVLDADRIARQLLEPGGAAVAAIQKRFGTIDRARLRELVFQDPEARKDLEGVLHPLIQAESAAQIRKLAGSPPRPVIYEAALIIETGRHQNFRGLIVVEAPEAERVRRIVARDGGTEAGARAVIAAQLSDAERRKVATFVIENHGTPEELRARIAPIAAQIKADISPSR